MKQSKYYTPDIEDLHINYECEFFNPANTDLNCLGHYYDSWDPCKILNGYNIFDAQRNDLKIRSKYLDTDDIISLGWIKTDLKGYFVRENERSLYRLEYIGTWLNIDLILKQRHPQFDIRYPGEFHEASDRGLFSGECKSINELRIIHKLLKIN